MVELRSRYTSHPVPPEAYCRAEPSIELTVAECRAEARQIQEFPNRRINIGESGGWAMGFEIIAPHPQVREITHHRSSIWAHKGAIQRLFWPKYFTYAVNRQALGIAYKVRVSFKRDGRVRMSQLLLSDFWIGTDVDQQACAGVSESVPSSPRNAQLVKQRPEAPLDQVVARIQVPPAVNEEETVLVRPPSRQIVFEDLR